LVCCIPILGVNIASSNDLIGTYPEINFPWNGGIIIDCDNDRTNDSIRGIGNRGTEVIPSWR